jgi:hypothetical protein
MRRNKKQKLKKTIRRKKKEDTAAHEDKRLIWRLGDDNWIDIVEGERIKLQTDEGICDLENKNNNNMEGVMVLENTKEGHQLEEMRMELDKHVQKDNEKEKEQEQEKKLDVEAMNFMNDEGKQYDEHPVEANIEYDGDIMTMLRCAEKKYQASADYMNVRLEINEKMRLILIDWLFLIQKSNRFSTETMFLAVSIIDRFLQQRPIHRCKLQVILFYSFDPPTPYPPTVLLDCST